MKKTYINPEIEVIKMKMNQHLLDASAHVEFDDTPVDGGSAVAHEDDFDW